MNNLMIKLKSFYLHLCYILKLPFKYINHKNIIILSLIIFPHTKVQKVQNLAKSSFQPGYVIK